MSHPIDAQQDAVQFTDVLLESSVVTPIGQIPGLDLVIDAGGLLMTSIDTRSTQTVRYGALREVRCGERAVLADGSPAVVVAAVVAGRPLRWLIPADQLPLSQAGALEELLGRRVDEARGADPPPVPAAGAGAPREPDPPPPAAWSPASSIGQPAQPAQLPVEPPQLPPQPQPVEPAQLPVPATQWARYPDPAGHRGVSGRPGPVEPERRRRWQLASLVVVVALLVAAAVVIPFAARSTPTRPAVSGAQSADRDLARQINLQAADLPAAWTVDRSGSGPLSGFLGTGTSTGGSSPDESALTRQVATQFEQCMGIPAAADRIFGPSGSVPAASASSPAFAAPSSSVGEEAGSSVDVYASARAVAADLAQIRRPQFPSCFGDALGTSFAGAASGAGQVGQPEVDPVSLPAHPGVTSSGVAVTVPLTASGTTVPVQFGVVLVGASRVEATLFTFSQTTPFPPALMSSLSLRLADNIAAESAGTAT
ncbi:MAG TPA: hypothetical protein VGL60_05890 [Acidimicrobiales bacterium]